MITRVQQTTTSLPRLQPPNRLSSLMQQRQSGRPHLVAPPSRPFASSLLDETLQASPLTTKRSCTLHSGGSKCQCQCKLLEQEGTNISEVATQNRVQTIRKQLRRATDVDYCSSTLKPQTGVLHIYHTIAYLQFYDLAGDQLTCILISNFKIVPSYVATNTFNICRLCFHSKIQRKSISPFLASALDGVVRQASLR